ncbi:MAG TPA: hypothetical protein VH415_11535 [Nitrososphaeraceae archaeon]|jgi:hypothetical protein
MNLNSLEDNLPTNSYAQRVIPSTITGDIFSGDASNDLSKEQGNAPHLGVNMRGYYSSMPQSREALKNPFPGNYYESSFKTLKEANVIDHVRYRFYWESYERDPIAFLEELEVVADTADKYGIKVIYDNHQFHTSSWLGNGTGFPAYFFNEPSLYKQGSGGATKYSSAQTWWTKWWDRGIKSSDGKDGWTLQAEFLRKIVETVDDHPSTLGYEILSEPQIHNKDQWVKIGKYNNFITQELRKVTDKILIYSINVPLDTKSLIEVNGENMAKLAPEDKKNIVMKMSLYGLPSLKYQSEKLELYLNASKITGVPLYIGEWNNVKRTAMTNEEGKKIWKIDANKSDINQVEANTIVETFEDLGVWGMAYWEWSFVPNDTPNLNLVNTTYDKSTGDAKLDPTKYFQLMKNAYINSHRN